MRVHGHRESCGLDQDEAGVNDLVGIHSVKKMGRMLVSKHTPLRLNSAFQCLH